MPQVLIRFQCPQCGNEWFTKVEENSYNSAEHCLKCHRIVELSEEEIPYPEVKDKEKKPCQK